MIERIIATLGAAGVAIALFVAPSSARAATARLPDFSGEWVRAVDSTAARVHMCVEYVELEIAQWLLDQGADVNARAVVGSGGFGGHTPLFSTVVSQPTALAWGRRFHDPIFVSEPALRLIEEAGGLE